MMISAGMIPVYMARCQTLMRSGSAYGCASDVSVTENTRRYPSIWSQRADQGPIVVVHDADCPPCRAGRICPGISINPAETGVTTHP